MELVKVQPSKSSLVHPLYIPPITTMTSRGIPLDVAAIMSTALEGILYGE